MNLLALLDELRTIARNGLTYAESPYDRERYTRLLDLATQTYSDALDLPPAEVRARLVAELGYVTPKVGSSAAIFDADGGVLLVRRADDGTWCLPCGWVDANEAPSDTAVRETREETGLIVRAVRLVDVFSLPAGISHVHSHVGIVYLCEVVGGELALSHESLDVRYWRIDDVPAWHPQHEERARAGFACWKQLSGNRQ